MYTGTDNSSQMPSLARTSTIHTGKNRLRKSLKLRAWDPGPRGYKTIFSCSTQLRMKFVQLMKKIKLQQFKLFSCTAELTMNYFLLINIKMPTTVGILIFISRKNFMLNWVEYEKMFYDLMSLVQWMAQQVHKLCLSIQNWNRY